MGDRTAFFYGTLMAPGVLYRVIYGSANPESWQKDLTTVRPALLSHFRRHKVKYADYPAIVPHQDASVRGSVVTGLTEGDIYRLDIFEGDQYTREKVKVKVLKDIAFDQAVDESQLEGEIVAEEEVETYVWQDPLSTLEEEEWDFEQFKKDKMRAWMGEVGHERQDVEVDEGFADVDRAVAKEEKKETHRQADPMGGRGVDGHITQQLKEAAV